MHFTPWQNNWIEWLF